MIKNINNRKNPKWSISIVIIFVLLISALIWVLTMNFVKQMLLDTWDLYAYHKAYYHAKAWLELSLIEIDNSGIGFSHKLEDSDFFVDNFECDNCGLKLNVLGKAKMLSDQFWINQWECNTWNSFDLMPWDTVVFPLFVEKENNTVWENIDTTIIYNKNIVNHLDDINFEYIWEWFFNINLGLVIVEWNEVKRDLLLMKKYTNGDVVEQYFEDYKQYYGNDVFDNDDYFLYLVLSNVNDENLPFCLNTNDPHNQWLYLAANKFYISSVWNFRDKSVWLTAILAQKIPNFIVNIYDHQNNGLWNEEDIQID